MSQKQSRRNFLALIGAVTIETAPPSCFGKNWSFGAGETLNSFLAGDHLAEAMIKGEGTAQAGILSATISWTDPRPGNPAAGAGDAVHVLVSRHADLAHPLVQATLPGDATSYRLGLTPSTTYYWSVVPVTRDQEVHERAAHGSFTTLAPFRDPQDNNDLVRYAGVRAGAHWGQETVVPPASPPPPLSPWFYRKHYDGVPSPTFDEVKSAFPVPILDGDPQMLDVYWYCWKTLMRVWLYPPSEPDHQAVANIIGLKQWGDWGTTMVWDTAFILQFARYGHHAYPFITGFDNCYARQHENGFVCRESDKNNRDVYWMYPVNPPLFAWAEWQSYQLTGDQDRLAKVLTPIVKQYEWWIRFQRRDNGLYWTSGVNEADDSPRNDLMYYAASATSYQALAALDLARMAKVVGRTDLVDYFESQHAVLGKMVNDHFWDEKHQLYNDLTKDGRFITELEPGVFCKHCHMFWPMLAEIAPPERIDGMVRELKNPKSFFLPSGVPSLSADSKYFNPPTGGYWKGSVWPPVQCLVQSGLKACGRWELAQELALKYLKASVTAYQQQHDVYEYLEPYNALGQGHGEFVGWGGIAPIQDLIEYALGFDISAPTETVTWHITRVDRHGIENLHVGKTKVDLLCDQRTSSTAPCRLTVKTDAPLTLVVHLNGTTTTKKLAGGDNHLTIG